MPILQSALQTSGQRPKRPQMSVLPLLMRKWPNATIHSRISPAEEAQGFG
jgi:hypothetical protein